MPPSKVDEAVSYFNDGLLCSQAILLSYAEQFGLDEDIAIRVSRSFGSGTSRMCETCGAVTGAYMVLGLMCQDEDEKAAKERNYALCRSFAWRFTEINGSTNCRVLLDCDLGTPEGQVKFREEKLLARCQSYVRCSAQILEQMFCER